MCRLLQAVVQRRTRNFEESEQYLQQELRTVDDTVTYRKSTPMEDGYSAQIHVSSVPKRVTLDVTPAQTPANLEPALPIMEGLVEKKGHSVAFLMWPK